MVIKWTCQWKVASYVPLSCGIMHACHHFFLDKATSPPSRRTTNQNVQSRTVRMIIGGALEQCLHFPHPIKVPQTNLDFPEGREVIQPEVLQVATVPCCLPVDSKMKLSEAWHETRSCCCCASSAIINGFLLISTIRGSKGRHRPLQLIRHGCDVALSIPQMQRNLVLIVFSVGYKQDH